MSWDRPQRAVLFLEEDSSVPEHSKPLMLEAVVFCPILTWRAEQLLADGVQQFFVVCGPVSPRKPGHACRRRQMSRFLSGRRI